ncbi:splicing factor, arginine/serine-rich 19 [Galendromus occidentalis]|uniref:Splicing factor, arginine/serine-rich 19 n=1 Tax=Galendromus occidentalis TaxID=34638 RepID=A0AAJ6VYZ5_9ACAR|nr:splicing factor, arginine/serine-rich 19 [Galendromus occidentalis]
MASTRKTIRSIEDHLRLGLPVLFSELVVFKWTPDEGFPPVSEGFRASFEQMQEVENLENELRVFFGSFERGLEALKDFEVQRNTFKFLDQYGTLADILKVDLLRLPSPARSLVPEYLEERIRGQAKWFRGEDDFSLDFAKEFLRRKFCTMRSSFKAPQPTSLNPPVPPPRRNRSGPARDSQPSTSQAMSAYTASGRLRRNSAPTTMTSPPKPRRMTAEELPSPPPTPPPLREGNDDNIGIAQENEANNESDEAEQELSGLEEAQLVPSTSPARPAPQRSQAADQEIPSEVIEDEFERNNNLSERNDAQKSTEDQPAVKSKIKNPVISDVDRPLHETAM